MTESHRSLPSLPRLAFAIAWAFFVLAAGFGFLLRLQVVHPVVPLEYAHLLHTHSHAAFLGWVFNAFFGLALHFFVPQKNHGNYWAVFLVMQLAAVGMLFTFPFQGYAAASIAFSTLHLASGAVFAWKLLRGNVAVAGARVALRVPPQLEIFALDLAAHEGVELNGGSEPLSHLVLPIRPRRAALPLHPRREGSGGTVGKEGGKEGCI